MTVLESIGYFFVWLARLVISLWNSILSVLNWFKPAVDFFASTFDFLPPWVLSLLVICIVIEVVLFVLHWGGDA